MDKEIKNGLFCACCLLTVFVMILGIIAIGSYENIQSENLNLKETIENQNMLIEILNRSCECACEYE